MTDTPERKRELSRERSRLWYAADPERARERARLWAAAHRESKSMYDRRRYAAKNPISKKSIIVTTTCRDCPTQFTAEKWRKRQFCDVCALERRREVNRRCRAVADHEHVRERDRLYRAANKERTNAVRRRWIVANPDLVRGQYLRRAERKKASRPPITDIVCQDCSTQFTPKTRRDKKFCGACILEHGRAASRAYAQRRKAAKSSIVSCRGCGVQFISDQKRLCPACKSERYRASVLRGRIAHNLKYPEYKRERRRRWKRNLRKKIRVWEASYDALREMGVDIDAEARDEYGYVSGPGSRIRIWRAAYDALREMGVDMNGVNDDV